MCVCAFMCEHPHPLNQSPLPRNVSLRHLHRIQLLLDGKIPVHTHKFRLESLHETTSASTYLEIISWHTCHESTLPNTQHVSVPCNNLVLFHFFPFLLVKEGHLILKQRKENMKRFKKSAQK